MTPYTAYWHTNEDRKSREVNDDQIISETGIGGWSDVGPGGNGVCRYSMRAGQALSKVLIALGEAEAGHTGSAENMATAAQNMLQAFINQVEALSGKKIGADDAAALVEAAQTLIERIGEIL